MAKTLGGEGAASFTQDAADSAQATKRASACPHVPAFQSAPPAVAKPAAQTAGGGLSPEGLAQVKATKGPPPVHLWNPPFCGEIDMEIKRDGTWFHEGTPIGRMPLVKLFAGILKREGDAYFLVTPVEKVRIRVEDAPFIAVDVDQTEGGFRFTTNLGDLVIAGEDHPLHVVTDTAGEPAPYIHIRRDLWARVDRKSFYRLAEQAEERNGIWGINSGGKFFTLMG